MRDAQAQPLRVYINTVLPYCITMAYILDFLPPRYVSLIERCANKTWEALEISVLHFPPNSRGIAGSRLSVLAI